MGLPVEYLKNQTHITDLQKLKGDELYFIIRLFRDELECFNKFDGFQLKGLIKACNETKDLIKDFRFILNGYMKLMIEKNPLPLDLITDIKHLLSIMDKIEKYLTKIKAVRLLKNTVNELVDSCLLNIRILYSLLNNFKYDEKHFWDTHLPLE